MKMLFIDNHPINITFNSFITRKNSISYICYSNRELVRRHSLLINIRKLISNTLNQLKRHIDEKLDFNIFMQKFEFNTDLNTYIELDLPAFYIAYGKSKNIDFYETDLKELYRGLRSYLYKLKDEIIHVYQLYSNQIECGYTYI